MMTCLQEKLDKIRLEIHVVWVDMLRKG